MYYSLLSILALKLNVNMKVPFSSNLNINEKRKADIILFISLYLLLFAIDYVFSFEFNTDLFTVLIWVCFMFHLLFLKPGFIFKYFYIIFIQLTNLVGVFIIENFAISLPELSTVSSDNNSLYLLALMHWLFFTMLFFFDDYHEKRLELNNKTVFVEEKLFSEFMLFLVFALIMSFLVKIAPNPAFALGLDRFQYSNRFLVGKWEFLFTLLYYLFPILSVMFVNGYKKSSLLVTLLFAIVLLLLGYKFGAFLDIIYLFVPAMIIIIGKNYKSLYVGLFATIVVLLMVIFAHNTLTYGNSFSNNVDYLLQRTAQQGQMWWSVYGTEEASEYHFNELNDELETYFTSDQEIKNKKNFGIYKMMRLVTPPSVFQRKINSGSRYASSTMASIYYYFNEIGFLFYIPAIAFVFSLIINLYHQSVGQCDVVESVIMARFILVLHSVMIQSDFDALFSKRMLLFLLMFIALKVFRFQQKKLTFNS